MPRRIRERPHRLPREAYQGRVCVSITANVLNRIRLFEDDVVVLAHLDCLERCAREHQCVIPIYCFMPDHLHLLVQGQTEEADTWQCVVCYKQHSGYWLGRNRPGIKFQKDFHDHVIRDDRDQATHLRYIARNPVKAGLVEKWDEYPWTGAFGVKLREALDELLE